MANNESSSVYNLNGNLDIDISCLDQEMIKKLTSAPKISKKKFTLSSLNIAYSKSYESLDDESTSAPSVLSEEQLLDKYFKFNLEAESDEEETEQIIY